MIEERVCKDTELVPLVRLQFRGLPESERKAFWFRNVTDPRGREYDGSVVLGSLGCSQDVYGAALGVESSEIAGKWATAHGNHMPPEEVSAADAPVKEVVLKAPDLDGGVDRFPHLI
ncbi:MAG: UbiD family decarboxylase, partial [Desulfuromonadales bacterium]|nr:UbiD family decarboxylase [Desulfuromonadales bacterium]